MQEETDKSLPVVAPNTEGAVEAMRRFQALKRDLLDPEDTMTIAKRIYVKRSGWRKVALAFNISTQIVDMQREKDASGRYVVRVRVRATAPNGRFSEEAAACDSTEFERGGLQGTLHNIESKAVTRAVNRAISDLVGGGEVSAEEMVKGEESGQQNAPKQTEQQPAPPGQRFRLITWKVKGKVAPIPVDSAPAGFLKKTLAAVEKAHASAAIALNEVGEHILDLRVSGLDEKGVKDVTGPLAWAVEKVFEVTKADVEVSVGEA